MASNAWGGGPRLIRTGMQRSKLSSAEVVAPKHIRSSPTTACAAAMAGSDRASADRVHVGFQVSGRLRGFLRDAEIGGCIRKSGQHHLKLAELRSRRQNARVRRR